MRKVIVGAMVSLDGVIQAPGGSTEDPTKGFKLGGWVMPYFDQEGGEEVDRLFKDFDLLLGRKTTSPESRPRVVVVPGKYRSGRDKRPKSGRSTTLGQGANNYPRSGVREKLQPSDLAATQKRCRQWFDVFESRKAKKKNR